MKLNELGPNSKEFYKPLLEGKEVIGDMFGEWIIDTHAIVFSKEDIDNLALYQLAPSDKYNNYVATDEGTIKKIHLRGEDFYVMVNEDHDVVMTKDFVNKILEPYWANYKH